MGIIIDGVEKEFNDINWKELSEDQYQAALRQLSSIQQNMAQRKRGGAAKFTRMPVTPKVAPKVIASDPYDFFAPNLPLFPEPIKQFSFPWWANHFYQECSDVDKKAFYKEVWNSDRSLKPRYDEKNASADRAVWRELLERMLKKGFEAFPDTHKGVDDMLFPPIKDDPNLRLGFRGELRQPWQVKAHNGCLPKAQVISLRKDMNMSALWHPFSDPAFRDKVYYRKGNGDNCLYTAVSVAFDFDTASKFPLLFDLKKDNPDAIGTATVEARGIASRVADLRAKLGDEITRQHFDPNWRATDAKPGYAPGPMPTVAPSQALVVKKDDYELRILKSVRMNVYLFRIRGTTWDTQKYQTDKGNASFPERAMDKIPWGDFLARIKIDRIHYGDDSNDGHLNVIHGFEYLHSFGDIRRMLGGGIGGDKALSLLTIYLRDLCARGRLLPDGSGGLPFTTAVTDPNIHIRRVVRIDPRTDWGTNPWKTGG